MGGRFFAETDVQYEQYVRHIYTHAFRFGFYVFLHTSVQSVLDNKKQPFLQKTKKISGVREGRSDINNKEEPSGFLFLPCACVRSERIVAVCYERAKETEYPSYDCFLLLRFLVLAISFVPLEIRTSRPMKREPHDASARSLVRILVVFVVLLLILLAQGGESSWVDPDTPDEDTVTQSLTDGDDREYRLVRDSLITRCLNN